MAAVKDRIVRKVSFLPKPCNLHFRSHGGHRATMRVAAPQRTHFSSGVRLSALSEKRGVIRRQPAGAFPPIRLCSIGEQSGERGLLRVANGATFIEITRAHVVAHPSPLHPREEKERERERESFFSFVYSFVYYSFFVDIRGENDSLRFLCQRTVVSTTVFASPTYFCARACFYFAYSSEYFFLSFDPLFILVAHLVTTAISSPSKSF